jgi:hypothetical protein
MLAGEFKAPFHLLQAFFFFLFSSFSKQPALLPNNLPFWLVQETSFIAIFTRKTWLFPCVQHDHAKLATLFRRIRVSEHSTLRYLLVDNKDAHPNTVHNLGMNCGKPASKVRLAKCLPRW